MDIPKSPLRDFRFPRRCAVGGFEGYRSASRELEIRNERLEVRDRSVSELSELSE